eukprot:3633115-Ditylum_brightwellii.AAC.1
MESDMQAVGDLTDTAGSYEGSSVYSNASKRLLDNYEEESGDGSAKLIDLEGSFSSSNWPSPI